MSYYPYNTKYGHGVLIGERHSWRDWELVPKNKLTVAPPPPDDSGLKVPGRHGKLFTAKAMTGDVVYGNRTGSWEFRVVSKRHFRLLYSEILDYLQGQELTAVLDDDWSFYYTGEFRVEKWDPGAIKDTISIKYDLQPFKMERASSLEDWLWDEFDFDCGIAREYHDLIVSGTRSLLIPGRRLQVCPGIKPNAAGMSVSYGGRSYQLTENRWNYFDGICLGEGDHTLTFTGSGTVDVDYRGGRL